jgi:uncharacterized protein (TIGR03067 family)
MLYRIALLAVALGVVAVGVGVAAPPAAAVKAETKKLEGVWTVTAQEHGGKPDPLEDLSKLAFIITAEKVIARFGDPTTDNVQRLGMEYQIDPAAQPKAIDLTYAEGELKGQKLLGIYGLDGDTLTICLSRGGARPTEFATQGTADRELTVLKRLKQQ